MKILRYFLEWGKWRLRGKPLRSRDEVLNRFSICAGCPSFSNYMDGTGTCNICGCNIKKDHTDHKFNKLSWATTKCPIGKWS